MVSGTGEMAAYKVQSGTLNELCPKNERSTKRPSVPTISNLSTEVKCSLLAGRTVEPAPSGGLSPAEAPFTNAGGGTHVQLAHLVLSVALREVLYVGQLQVHLCEPDQNALPGALELLPLVGEVL